MQLKVCQPTATGPGHQPLGQLLSYIAVIKDGPYQCQLLQAGKLAKEHLIQKAHQLTGIILFSLKRLFPIFKVIEKVTVIDHRQRDHSRQLKRPRLPYIIQVKVDQCQVTQCPAERTKELKINILQNKQ